MTNVVGKGMSAAADLRETPVQTQWSLNWLYDHASALVAATGGLAFVLYVAIMAFATEFYNELGTSPQAVGIDQRQAIARASLGAVVILPIMAAFFTGIAAMEEMRNGST